MQKKEQKARASSPLQELKQKVNELSTVYEKLSVGYDWLKWSHRNLMTMAAIVLSVMGIGFAVLFFAIRDTKQDIAELKSSTKQDIQEIRQLLIQLIQKQTPSSVPDSGKR